MTEERTASAAEKFVYTRCNLFQIVYLCELFGILTRKKSGKMLSRTMLEESLIEVLTEKGYEEKNGFK